MNVPLAIAIFVMYVFSGRSSQVLQPEKPEGMTEMRLRVVADTEWSMTSYAPPEPLEFYYQGEVLLTCDTWVPASSSREDGRLDCGYSAWVPVGDYQPEIIQSETQRQGYYWAFFEFKSPPVIESRLFMPVIQR